MARGGYQRPSNPAPVSGPGAGSKRTDGGPAQKLRELPDAQYGEAATFRDLQNGAPLAQSPSPGSSLTTASGGGAVQQPVGFDAPTQFPDMPVTSGVDAGPGNGSSVLSMNQTPQMDPSDVERIRAYLPALMAQANDPSSTQAFRNYVRILRSQVL